MLFVYQITTENSYYCHHCSWETSLKTVYFNLQATEMKLKFSKSKYQVKTHSKLSLCSIVYLIGYLLFICTLFLHIQNLKAKRLFMITKVKEILKHKIINFDIKLYNFQIQPQL